MECYFQLSCIVLGYAYTSSEFVFLLERVVWQTLELSGVEDGAVMHFVVSLAVKK